MQIFTVKKTFLAWDSWVRALVISLAFLTLPGLAGAQTARDSALYLRAQQMVANGDATAGRKLADSVAAAAPTGSAAYAEGLYWRATVADNARDSEHEYRQIIVDYPLSGRVPDALIRIGQLESARGENAAALQHFQRLVLEHPESPLHADGSYWVARMYFDANDVTRACTANADAVASVPAANVELKNRILFQQQRCRGVALATNASPAPVTVPVNKAPPAVAPKAPAAKAATKAETKTASKVVVADRGDTNSRAVTRAAEPAQEGMGTARGAVSRAPTKEEVDRALASAKRSEIVKAAMVRAERERAEKATQRDVPVAARMTPIEQSDESKAGRGSYAVQVAAFGTKPPATLLVARLRGRGYNAYIDGTHALYRVRIGHYPTNAAAAAGLVRLKARKLDGFVVER